MKKILSSIVAGIMALLMLWAVFSTLEVSYKNDRPNPEYSAVNLWNIVFGGEN